MDYVKNRLNRRKNPRQQTYSYERQDDRDESSGNHPRPDDSEHQHHHHPHASAAAQLAESTSRQTHASDAHISSIPGPSDSHGSHSNAGLSELPGSHPAVEMYGSQPPAVHYGNRKAIEVLGDLPRQELPDNSSYGHSMRMSFGTRNKEPPLPPPPRKESKLQRGRSQSQRNHRSSGDASMLEDIYNEILDMAEDYRELSAVKRKDPFNAVVHILEQYKNVVAEDERKKENLRKFKTADLESSLKERDLKETKNRLERSEKERKDLQNRHKKLLEDKQKSENERIGKINKLKKEHEGEMQKLKNKHEHLKQENSGVISRHKADLKALQHQHQSDIAQLEAKLTRQQQEIIGGLQKQLADEKSGVERRLASARQAHEQHISELESKHKLKIDELEAVIGIHVRNREAEKAQMEHERLALEKQMERDYELRTAGLQDTVEVLKGKLVKREHIKSLPDHVLASRFAKILEEIKDFSRDLSRMQWDTVKRPSFPFPETELDHIHPENTRILKLHLVQNTLWLILYSGVFSTPFKVLGTEGAVLDNKWMDFNAARHWSSAEKWPIATDHSEKYRYEKAGECLEAIRQKPNVDLSPENQRRRASYRDAVANIVEDISRSVNAITALDPGQREAMNALVSSAAELWLEVCSQRYRTMVSLPVDTRNYLVSTRGDIRMMKLVIRPELKRFGNAQGEDLTKEEIVGGWNVVTEDYDLQG